MKNNGKHPIIGNGQHYIEPLIKKTFGSEPAFPHEYSEAKARLSTDIEKIQNLFSDSEEIFIDEKIVCVRLEPNFEAKSYTPNSLIVDSDMKLVGGRKYTVNRKEATKGKLYFMRTNNEDLEKLKIKLISGQKDHVKKWKKQICTIKSIDLLNPDEKVLGFDVSWTEGTVEVVIHPLGIDQDRAIEGFFNATGIQKEKATVRSYDDGLTFICTYMDKELVDKAKKYNPLRSVKPISDDWDDPFRMSAMVAPAPKLPKELFRSDIKIGIFDGGIQEGTKLLEPFVTNYDMVEEKPTEKGLDHGAGVCGAALYGNLAGKTEVDEVENPVVSVESFRVFPAKKTGNAEADMQMYTTIDIIEDVVRKRGDIKLYGLSFGPRGAILDDEINRFTYVCDKLTYDVDEGEITASASVRLPIFMPEINVAHGNANIKWTICTVVNPNLNDTDAYTNNCIEDTFYPNEMKFAFRKRGNPTRNLNLLKQEDVETARMLISQGYTKSDLPISKPAKKNFREADLRNSDFKWDTMIRKNVSMRCSSLINPFLSLHAIGRDEYEHEKIKYFVVITVDVPNFKGSLYDNILHTYPNLIPVSIQNINRVMTQIK